MITVVLPVLNQIFLTNNLLGYISSNMLRPIEIILIDNASTEDIHSLVQCHKDLNIVYLRQKRNIGVNASWNLGISLAKGNLISILNNDIIITSFFFKYIDELMSKHKDVGICVPSTTNDKFSVMACQSYPYIKTSPLGKREGWAFTIRSEIAKRYPIPESLKMFFGDDYLFANARKENFRIVKMVTNPIYHYGSITIEKNIGNVRSIKLLKEEREIWEKVKSSLISKTEEQK